MSKKSLPVDRKQYDHPEHHRDKIEEYRSEDRYVPVHLQDLLLEQCGHRCSICKEPSFEFHHINHLENGGETTYENLIVLCPNCHTRVHKDDMPDEKHLLHYKMKQEIVDGLPIIGKLSDPEKRFICEVSKMSEREQSLYLKKHGGIFEGKDEVEARKALRKQVGLLYLQSEEIIRSQYDLSIGTSDGKHALSLLISISGKGIRWIRYLVKSGMIENFISD